MSIGAILVDHRECAPGLLAALATEHGFGIEIVQLPLGDYLIDRTVLVERKTTRDFAVSLVDGRLFRQAHRLATESEHALMVVEGESFQTDIGVEMQAVRGALITLAQTFRLPVLRTRSEAETAWTFARLREQRRRVGTKFGAGSGCRRVGAERRKLRVLCAVPGVGPTMAKALLGHFGSVSATLAASREELLAVKGFGPRRADLFRETVMEGPAVWLTDRGGGGAEGEAGP